MSKEEFYLHLLQEGKEYLKIIIPFLIALHMPQPNYMKKDAQLVQIKPEGEKNESTRT